MSRTCSPDVLFITGEIQILEMMAQRKEAVDKDKGKPAKLKKDIKTEVV